MKLNGMQRTRLKLTIAGMIVIVAVLIVPIVIIFRAAEISLYEVNAPWIFLGTAVTAFATLAGYYINKESHRPSLMTQVFNPPVKRIMDGEDESDDEDMPI